MSKGKKAPKVLVVEDLGRVHEGYRRKLGGKVEIVSAFSSKEAEEQFAANPDVAAIVMDGYLYDLTGCGEDTQSLVRKFRETFRGPMIASSNCNESQQQLMEAGCDHMSDKELVPEKLIEVLGL